MRGTFVFSFKSWSRFHPPLPRTPRESQQLLNALTSSFRRQLDREYPPLQAAEHSDKIDPSSENPNSSVHATDKHLKAILENPLFGVVPSRSVASQGHHDTNGQGNPAHRRMQEQPMAVFDEMVASGTVTRFVLLDCLQSQLILSSSPRNNSIRGAMKDSKAGSKVVDWFWASDSLARKMLFKKRAATAPLLKFMVVEELQDTIMVWLRMILKQDVGGLDGKIPEAAAPRLFSNMLEDFMAAELRYGRGVDTALSFYIQVCKMHSSLVDRLANESKKAMLFAAASYLSDWIVQHAQDTDKKASLAVYEQFRDVMASLFPGSPLAGCVSLYHPTTPAPGPLVTLMKKVATENRYQVTSRLKRESLLHVCFDALCILIDQGKYQDASSLAQSIQILLPTKSSRSASQEADRSSPLANYPLDRFHLGLA